MSGSRSDHYPTLENIFFSPAVTEKKHTCGITGQLWFDLNDLRLIDMKERLSRETRFLPDNKSWQHYLGSVQFNNQGQGKTQRGFVFLRSIMIYTATKGVVDITAHRCVTDPHDEGTGALNFKIGLTGHHRPTVVIPPGIFIQIGAANVQVTINKFTLGAAHDPARDLNLRPMDALF